MSRREFPNRVKAEAALRAMDKCERCGASTKHKPVHFDHDIPDNLGGEPVLSNCTVLCVPCHKEKTRSIDLPRITKGRRIRKREMGIKRRSAFACSRQSRWKKKIDGTVVLR